MFPLKKYCAAYANEVVILSKPQKQLAVELSLIGVGKTVYKMMASLLLPVKQNLKLNFVNYPNICSEEEDKYIQHFHINIDEI